MSKFKVAVKPRSATPLEMDAINDFMASLGYEPNDLFAISIDTSRGHGMQITVTKRKR